MMIAAALAATMFLTGYTTARAQETDEPSQFSELMDILANLELFRLWNDCAPVPVQIFVKPGADIVERIGLTDERMRTVVEGRLRGGRIYDGDVGKKGLMGGDRILIVNVLLQELAFSMEAAFFKQVVDIQGMQAAYETEGDSADPMKFAGSAKTWDRSAFGMYGGDAGFILQALGELTDSFVNSYLRENVEACD